MSSLAAYDPTQYSSSNSGDGEGDRNWNFSDFEDRAVAYLVVKGGRKGLGRNDKGSSKAMSDKVRERGERS